MKLMQFLMTVKPGITNNTAYLLNENEDILLIFGFRIRFQLPWEFQQYLMGILDQLQKLWKMMAKNSSIIKKQNSKTKIINECRRKKEPMKLMKTCGCSRACIEVLDCRTYT